MKQDVKGTFSMTLNGIPGLIKLNGALRSERGYSVLYKSIVVGPFAIGLIKKERTNVRT